MNLRRPPRWLAITLGVSAAAALSAWWWSTYIWVGAVQLADGREVRVRAVTYGTNHVFVDGPLWVRLARRQMSTAKATRLGLGIYQRSSAGPSCMVWTQWRGTNNPPRFASMMNAQGLESEPIPVTVYAPIPGQAQTLVAWQWENFPRRQTKSLLRFYDRDAAYRPLLAGQMPVRNPAGRSPRSSAPVAPVRVTDGGIEFSLLSLSCGESPRTPWAFVAPPATAVFQVVEDGQPSASWTLRSLVGRGDTGNRFHIQQPALERSLDRLATSFPDVLWPEEPAWRLIAEFSRTRDRGADASITMKDIPAARTNPPFTTNLQAQAEGVIVQSVDLRGTSRGWNHVRGRYFPNSDLTLLYTANVQRAQVYLARALDDQGRELRFGDETHPWRGKYTAALEIPRDTRSVDLTFAIHRSRFVEFQVRPVWGRTIEAGPRQDH